MFKLSGTTAIGALILALAVLGCTTALAITGHISGTEALTIITTILGAASTATGVHVAAKAQAQLAKANAPIIVSSTGNTGGTSTP